MTTIKLGSISDHQFQWDPLSAGKKFFCDSAITLSIGVVSVTKITPENDKEKNAYRNCSICGKHYNYHKHD